MSRIKAVVGVGKIKGFKAWEIARIEKAKQIFLDADAAVDDVGAIFAQIARELKIPDNAPAESTVTAIIERGKFPDGSIRIFGDDADGNERIVSTGCCFDGVHAWRNLVEIVAGNFVWLGHSPSPVIEYLPNGTIRIWADGEGKAQKNFFLEFTKAEFKKMLLRLEKDLADFDVLLELWAEQNAAPLTKKIIEEFGFCTARKF